MTTPRNNSSGGALGSLLDQMMEQFTALVGDWSSERSRERDARAIRREQAVAVDRSDRRWRQVEAASKRGDHEAASVLAAEAGRQQAKAWGWEPKSKRRAVWRAEEGGR